jgi:hypothetical protein
VFGLAALVLLSGASAARAQQSSPQPAASFSDLRPTLIIGFMGGFVSHEDRSHGEVQFAEHLRQIYPSAVHVQVFENRRVSQAREEVLRFVRQTQGRSQCENSGGSRAANVILYGHSWGAAAVVSLARKLERDCVPVVLTVQIDSVARPGANDSIIPANVVHAANFFQPGGLLHGRSAIRAANSARTQIIGNFRFDYDKAPVTCHGYPWWNRVFTRNHMEIECDPKIWSEIDLLIRSELHSQTAAESAGAVPRDATSFEP